MKRVHVVFIAALLALTAVAVSARQTSSGADRLNADVFKSLKVRNIGPTLVTGRVVDIAIDAKNPSTWFVASAFGGLWKTTNRGITFKPVFPVAESGEVQGFNNCCV